MVHDLNNGLLKPGAVVEFKDRDDLLETLDRLEQRIPARHEGRTKVHREHLCMLRYLRLLAGENLLSLPAILKKPPEGKDPPDFVLEFADGLKETFELTDGSTQDYQRKLSAASRIKDRLVLPVDINTPTEKAAQLWADILFFAFLEKAIGLTQGRFDLDHLLLYDLTGLNLLLSLEEGAPILRQKLLEWYAQEEPTHRFGRVSVLRDDSLLLDVGKGGRVLDRESPYFQLPVIRARDGEDLRKRLREIDCFCRENSIRQLKALGSTLCGPPEDFLDEIGLDLPEEREEDLLMEFANLLVEFEPGARITLLDIDRMARELGELIGFNVNLYTETPPPGDSTKGPGGS
jgi:hypothetical protein